MDYQIKPSTFQGYVTVPSSKSHTLRAILMGMMGQGTTTIYRYLSSPDTDSMIKAIQNFGAKVHITPSYLEIEGLGGKLGGAEDVIDSGNSGQVLRFMGALSALSSSYTVITGDHSIRHRRPVQPLLKAFSQVGVFAESMRLDGKAPILIKGPFKGGVMHLNGQDSQPVSGLIMAASFAPFPTEIHVENPGETPWIDLTLHWLDRLGLEYVNKKYRYYAIPGKGSYQGFSYTVPGDFSSLAFPLAAALITNSELVIQNVDMEDCQGDKKLIDLLIKMGACIEWHQSGGFLTVKKGARLKGVCVNANECIDAVPILAVLGCFAQGETTITHAEIARKKESDRLSGMTCELRKMGANIIEKRGGLIIKESSLKGATLQTYRDHRIALSLSVAAFGASGHSVIQDSECMNKTYASFCKDFQKIGASIRVLP